jgi:16S rRNA (guanine527-N7)-methyltransferase
MTFREKLAIRARDAGFDIENALIDPLETYFRLLQQWNPRVSLTALPIQELGDEAVDRLLIEPLIAARYLPQTHAATVDIGSGGGSPAIPLKIGAPRIQLCMVESRSRKAAFLREVVRVLDLSKTTVEGVRAEELPADFKFKGGADVVTMRAVRVDAAIVAVAHGLLKPGGALFLFTKAQDSEHTNFPGFTISARHPLVPSIGTELAIYSR